MKRKIYLASSWRNPNQPKAVTILREAGHEVYDFRHPKPGDDGFSWGDIAAAWLNWAPNEFVEGLKHPIAQAGFKSDKDALDWCDTCVLLLPCGRSAHLEAGYAIGWGKPTLIVLDQDRFEPELMYLLADVVVPGIDDMLSGLDRLRRGNKMMSFCSHCLMPFKGDEIDEIKDHIANCDRNPLVIENHNLKTTVDHQGVLLRRLALHLSEYACPNEVYGKCVELDWQPNRGPCFNTTRNSCWLRCFPPEDENG